ncbi:MAG: GNAT family N-acetyltransferase [Janthinobacterium lividum]
MTEARLWSTQLPDRRFRLAVVDDLEVVQALSEAAYAPYTALLGYPPLPATEDYRPRIQDGQVHLAEVAGTVVGLLVLERHLVHAMIYSVAVMSDRQGEGHGLALLRLAEEEARSWGVFELRLYTNALMERNIGLYAAIGFRETGRRPHPKRSSFTIVDMSRPLV